MTLRSRFLEGINTKTISILLTIPVTLFIFILAIASTNYTMLFKIDEETKTLANDDKVDMVAVSFIESATSQGIMFEHQRRSRDLNSIADSYGNGVCILDFDNDGFDDIFVTAGQGTTRRYGKEHWWNSSQYSTLYKNINGLYFEPVELDSNMKLTGFGCTIGDINNDGLNDIIVGGTGKIHLLINTLDNSFIYQYEVLPSPNDWPTSMLIKDVNGDELSDIVIATLVDYRNDLKVGDFEYAYQGNSAFGTGNYTGQNNLALIALPNKSPENLRKNTLKFKTHVYPGQQRTLSILPLDIIDPSAEYNGSFLMVNANGSNSVMQHINNSDLGKHSLSWLTFPAAQISPIKVLKQDYFVITNHGSKGIQLVNVETKINQAWSRNITNNNIDSSQSWATLVSDFNNDGLDDVALATGYATPALNTPSRPQGSPNHLLFQDDNGNFVRPKETFVPALSRSSRGAAYADFNNDGFLDIIFVNNNNFMSLYINQANKNNWVSFICTPIRLCKNSRWELKIPDSKVQNKLFNTGQPYLSHVSPRVSFGLGSRKIITNLSIQFGEEEKIYSSIGVNKVYKIDLSTGKMEAAPTVKEYDDVFIDSENLFHLIMSSDEQKTLFSLLSTAKFKNKDQFINLLKLLSKYKKNLPQLTHKFDLRFTVTLSWALTEMFKNAEAYNDDIVNKLIINLLMDSENRAFIDLLQYVISKSDSTSFCYFTQELAHWYEEEEILPETKLGLLPVTLQRGLRDGKEAFQCAIEAVSLSRDTTIGASLLPYIYTAEPVNKAIVIKSLGKLKYSRSLSELKAFCLKTMDEIIFSECQITLSKLTNEPLSIGVKVDTRSKQFFSIHSEELLIKNGLGHRDYRGMLEYISQANYHFSMVKDHRYLGYLALLEQDEFNLLLETSRRHEIKDFVGFIKLARINYSEKIDNFIQYLFWKNSPLTESLLTYASSVSLQHFISDSRVHLSKHKLASALIRQCILRESLIKKCDDYFGGKVYLHDLTFYNLSQLSLPKLYFLIAIASEVEKRVIARQLYRANMSSLEVDNDIFIVDALNEDQLYRQLEDVDLDWLNKFLGYSFQLNFQISSLWLEQYGAKYQQDDLPWIALYLNHNLNNKYEMVNK